jgi:hypothetical protein
MAMMYLTPDMRTNVKDYETVCRIADKYYGSCIRMQDNTDELCKQELIDVGEVYVAEHMSDFMYGDG